MTMLDSISVDCPQCGCSQEATVSRTVNVTNDPELKEQLINGHVNLFTCGKCGMKGFLPVPLLYHDMALKFCVQYYPESALDDPEFLGQFKPDGTYVFTEDRSVVANSYIAKPHIVFAMDELVRYVIFRDKVRG